MKRKIKNKKSYKELIDKIKNIENIVLYYKGYLEQLGILFESYVQMNEDEDKLVNYIKEKGKESFMYEFWPERFEMPTHIGT